MSNAWKARMIQMGKFGAAIFGRVSPHTCRLNCWKQHRCGASDSQYLGTRGVCGVMSVDPRAATAEVEGGIMPC